MGNVYKDHEDTTIKGMMDAMHSRVKNPGGVKPLGFNDHVKPSLDYQQGAPLRIKPVKESVKKLTIQLPW